MFEFVGSILNINLILSMAEKRIADDWFAEYKIRPVLMETFVDGGS